MDKDELAREASDRVREVIERAEQQAGEIIREAKADADRIRAGAEAEVRNAPVAASPAPAPAEPEPATPAEGGEAARLVALKMALDGTSREDVASHLADEYGLSDSAALLDDVFARAGK